MRKATRLDSPDGQLDRYWLTSASGAVRDSLRVELRRDMLGHEPEGTSVRWDHAIDF